MSNWMSGIYQAASGLDAARYGMSVVSQNMANATTPGYTRQTAALTAVDMSPVSGISTGRGSMGGVAINGTTRNTDVVLDARLRTEDAKSALADTGKAQLQAVESVLGEPSDSGLSVQLDKFWNSWATVAANPSSEAARTVLLRNAGSVAATLNTMSAGLSDTAAGVSLSLGTDVDSLNTAAGRLAALNGQIAVGAAVGGNVNSLLDERDTLLGTMSSLAGVTVNLDPNGVAQVSLGGQSLVSGVVATSASVDAAGTVSVGGTPVAVAGGSMAARITALTTTLPTYKATLDSVAASLADTVNTAMTGGYDAGGAAGTAMFSGSTAADIAVSLTDPMGIAASGVPGGGRDNSVAIAMSQAALRPGSADALFSALVGNVASASAAAQQRADTQDAVHGYVTNIKTAMSGVSFDEEATNMMAFQQAFNASSRVLTAIDSMLDTLINRTGLVGRS